MASVEDVWKIHEDLVKWTSNVDSKASITLAIESATLAGVIALTGDHRRLSHLEWFWPATLFWVGTALLILAVLCVAAVVTPQIRAKESSANWRDNVIFFGHLRHWSDEALTTKLEETAMLPMLSRQLIVMSKIAWRKHRSLQASMLCALAGTAMLGICAAIR